MARTRPDSGGGDDRDDRDDQEASSRTEQAQARSRRRAVEQAEPEPAPDAQENVTETIENRERKEQLDRRAPEPASNAQRRVSATIVERRQEQRRGRDQLDVDNIRDRRDVDDSGNPTAPTSTAVREESDRDTYTDRAIDAAAGLEDRVADLPGVGGATERIKSGAALTAAGAGAARDALEPVTEPVVGASRGAQESLNERIEGAGDFLGDVGLEGERGERVESALEGALEGGGRTATALTVGLPAGISDTTDAFVGASQFTAEQIDEEGVVRGTAQTTEAAGELGARAARAGGRALEERPAETLGRATGSLAVGFGAGSAAAKTTRAARGLGGRLELPDRREFLGDERGMAGGQRTVAVEKQEQRAVDEATPIDELDEATIENRARQTELELEQQAPEGQTARSMFESEDALDEAIEQRTARNILEERAPGETTLDEMIPDAELRTEQITQARSRLFERETDLEAGQTARAATQQQTAAAAATGTGAAAAELAAFADRDQGAELDEALGGVTGGATAAEASAQVDQDQDERAAPGLAAPGEMDTIGEFGEPALDGRVAPAFDTPADQLEDEGTGELERSGQPVAPVTEPTTETTTETTVDRQLEQTVPTPPPPALTTTARPTSSSSSTRFDWPDEDEDEFLFLPRGEGAAQDWRTPITRAGEVLEDVFGVENRGGS